MPAFHAANIFFVPVRKQAKSREKRDSGRAAYFFCPLSTQSIQRRQTPLALPPAADEKEAQNSRARVLHRRPAVAKT
jgi:hypothetical protein